MQLGDYKRAVVSFWCITARLLHIGWCSEEQHCFRQFSATAPLSLSLHPWMLEGCVLAVFILPGPVHRLQQLFEACTSQVQCLA